MNRGWDMRYLAMALALVSLWGLWLCWADKRRARRNKWRVPEKAFFLTALLGGGPGVWAGMYLFRHKTRHWYFVVFIPLITLVEYGFAAWLLLRMLSA